MIDANVVIPPLISAAVTLVVCIVNARAEADKTRALISYRLEQLEKKVEKHNNLIERTYSLEERAAITEEKIKVANHRLDDLEKEATA